MVKSAFKERTTVQKMDSRRVVRPLARVERPKMKLDRPKMKVGRPLTKLTNLLTAWTDLSLGLRDLEWRSMDQAKSRDLKQGRSTLYQGWLTQVNIWSQWRTRWCQQIWNFMNRGALQVQKEGEFYWKIESRIYSYISYNRFLFKISF